MRNVVDRRTVLHLKQPPCVLSDDGESGSVGDIKDSALSKRDPSIREELDAAASESSVDCGMGESDPPARCQPIRNLITGGSLRQTVFRD